MVGGTCGFIGSIAAGPRKERFTKGMEK